MSVHMCVYVLARSMAGACGATGLVKSCDVCLYMYVCFGPCVLLPVMLVVSLCRAASTFTAVASKLGHLISVHALLM